MDLKFEPIEKGSNDRKGMFSAIASTAHRDLDGEIMEQESMDWSPFLDSGHFVFMHPFQTLNIVGDPTGVRRGLVVEGEPATGVDGFLYLTDPYGKALWDKAIAMKRAGSNRRLTLSVEGEGVRTGDGKIKNMRVRNVAFTKPRNPHANVDIFGEVASAAMEIAKGMVGYPVPTYAQAGEFGPLVPPSMGSDIASVISAGLTKIRDARESAALSFLMREFNVDEATARRALRLLKEAM